MSYAIDEATGDIICSDGHVISIPYDDPRYQDYAEWVQAGNKPPAIPE